MSAKLRYYLRRAAEAPPQVVVGKIWWKLKPFVFWPAYAGFRSAMRGLNNGEAELRCTAAIAFGRGIAERIRKSAEADPDFIRRGLRRAQEAAEGHFSCLGYGHAAIPAGSGWHADPFHGYSWPVRYFANIDYVAADVRADVKVPWELSRFQYLVWLAEGLILDPANAERYREAFGRIVVDWTENNPPAYGVNWTCPMEVGIRAINLFIAFTLFAPDLGRDVCRTVVRSLAEHAQFIAQFPELSDIPGNHLLANLAGEVFCHAVVAQQDRSAFDRSVGAFLKEAESQFEPAGCQLERAPVYHRLCLDMVAVVLALAVRFENADAAGLRAILVRGLDFCRAVGSASQKLPVIGDCDSGQILLLLNDARDYSGLLEYSDALESKATDLSSDMAHWLWAISGLDLPVRAARRTSADEQPATDDRSGFLSARYGDLVAVMRVGEQGLKGRASHDHDDALSIWLSKGDHDLIVEAGCHSYTLDRVLREGYIGSRAHNVVQRRGLDRYAGAQGSICRTMRGAPTADSWHGEVETGEARLRASLAVPARPQQPFRSCVRRLTLHSPERVTIEDAWAWADGSHEAELNWHLGPGLRPVPTPRGADIFTGDGILVMTLTIASGRPVAVEPFEYQYSPVYGTSQTCHGLRLLCSSHEECQISSTFAVNSPD